MTAPSDGTLAAALATVRAAGYGVTDPPPDPRTRPQCGDRYWPVFGQVEKIVGTGPGTVRARRVDGTAVEYTVGDWASGPGRYIDRDATAAPPATEATVPWDYVTRFALDTPPPCTTRVDGGPVVYHGRGAPGTLTVTFFVPEDGPGACTFRDLARALRGRRL